MTVESGQSAKATDSEASLRDVLRDQLASAQAELSANLIELRRGMGADASIIARADAQLGALLALKRQLDHASPATLAMIRSEVAASIAAASSTAEQAHAASLSADQRAVAVAELATASAAARTEVASFARDFYERKIFDPYLKFTSAEDEEAYRRREAELQRDIAKAMAENTPEGTLRASQLSIQQLKDAGAHGADRSPEFKQNMDRLVQSGNALDSAINAKRAVTPQQGEQSAPVTGVSADPLASVGAKTPNSKGVAAVLLAAGLSAPQSDNIGHGVTQVAQSASPTRAV